MLRKKLNKVAVNCKRGLSEEAELCIYFPSSPLKYLYSVKLLSTVGLGI